MIKTLVLPALIAASTGLATAQNSILFNFHTTNGNDPGPVAGDYLTLSPAHALGALPLSATTWNNFNTAAPVDALLDANGGVATGVAITFGLETIPGSGTIDFLPAPAINTSALVGTGGSTPNQQPLVGNPSSIYGDGNNPANSAPGRAGWLGSGSNVGGDTAIGIRIDGLTAGVYTVYVMGRNTNGNGAATPMNFYAAAGSEAEAFSFGLLTPAPSANPVYPTSEPDAYNTFLDGENFVAMEVTIAEGESLFLASDSDSATETRGFFNMVQVVAVPEPGTLALLAAAGIGLCVFARGPRRR